MRRALLTGIVANLALALAAIPAFAGTPPASSPQAYVVLVGIGHYADPQLKDRPHAEADAKALYDIFTNAHKKYLPVDKGHVRLLLGKADSSRHSEPATRENILKDLRWAASQAGRDDMVVFAYIGDGAPVGERACYFASDSTFKDRTKDAVATPEIEAALEKLKSHRFVAMLDVNFKGFDAGKNVPDMNLLNFYKLSEYLGTHEQVPQGRVVFMATQKIAPPVETEKHDIFTEAMLKGLRGGADREGYEPDGLVTVDEMVKYLEKEVHPLALKYGKSKEEKEQLPLLLQSDGSHFVLTHNPAAYDKAQAQLQKFKTRAQEENLSAKLTEEGEKLLERMPKLKAYQKLRKAYEQFTSGTLTRADFEHERTAVHDSMKMTSDDARAWATKVMNATELLDSEYVKHLNQGELTAWAIQGMYREIEEKVPQDIQARLKTAKEMKEDDLLELVTDARQRLGKREDLANHHALDFALKRMTRHLDPYTTYIDPEQLAKFRQDTQGFFTGIGIQIRKDSLRDMLMVVSPIKGSPAYKAGIKAGDTIVKIIREVDSSGAPLDPPEVIDARGLDLSDAVKKILGKPGTPVKLEVSRKEADGSEKNLNFEIRRGHVEIETVIGTHRSADDSWSWYIDPANKIAYVRLTSFARNTARDLDRALIQMQRQGIKGFILDLRFNPGGLLTSATEISDRFIDDGTIVTIRPRVGKETTYSGQTEGSLLDFPMVCLVNGGSASGSEIVSACLQDHHRAIIMGERSYGKGSVQNIVPFENGELKLTTASFWRPSGANLNRASTKGRPEDVWGVTPDKGFLLKLSPTERFQLEEYLHNQEIIPRRGLPAKTDKAPFDDRQLDMALNYLRGQIKTVASAPVKKDN